MRLVEVFHDKGLAAAFAGSFFADGFRVDGITPRAVGTEGVGSHTTPIGWNEKQGRELIRSSSILTGMTKCVN